MARCQLVRCGSVRAWGQPTSPRPSEAQLHIAVTASDSTEGTAPQDLPAVLAACGLEHRTSAFEAENYTLKSLLAAMKEGDRAAMRDLHELGLNLGESRKLINQLKKASRSSRST